MNQELININQDPLSPQAKCMVGCSWWDNLLRRPSVWVTSLGNGD